MRKTLVVFLTCLMICCGFMLGGCNKFLFNPFSPDLPPMEETPENPPSEEPSDGTLGEEPSEEESVDLEWGIFNNGYKDRDVQYELIWAGGVQSGNSIILEVKILTTGYIYEYAGGYYEWTSNYNVVSNDPAVKFASGKNAGTSTYVDDDPTSEYIADGYPKVFVLDDIKINIEGDTTVEKVLRTKFSVYRSGALVGEFRPELPNITSTAYKFVANEEDNYSLEKSGTLNNVRTYLLNTAATDEGDHVALDFSWTAQKTSHIIGSQHREKSIYYRLVASDKELKFNSGDYLGYSTFTSSLFGFNLIDQVVTMEFLDVKIPLSDVITKERIEQTKFSLYRGSLLVGEFKVEIA